MYNIQKRLASHETVNSEIISIKLKEYLDLLENQKEYLVLSAKQIVRIISIDLLKMQNKNMVNDNIDNTTILSSLKKIILEV